MPAHSFLSRVLRLQFSLRALLLLMLLMGVAIAIYRWPWVETTEESDGYPKLLYDEEGWGIGPTKISGRWKCEWQPFKPYPNIFAGKIKYRVATSYRRSWTGRPERHGRQQVWRLTSSYLQLAQPPDQPLDQSVQQPWILQQPLNFQEPWLLKEKYYVHDDLRHLNRYNGGVIEFTEGRLNGVPHGDHRSDNSVERSEGRYQHGKRVGNWKISFALTYAADSERVVVEQSYHQGLLHGAWTWRTPGGRVLQMAKYEMGRLVEWNGLPTEQALEKLLQQSNLPEESRQQLTQGRTDEQFHRVPASSNETAWNERAWYLGSQEIPEPTHVLIFAETKSLTSRWPVMPLEELKLSLEEPPLRTVLENALARSETLVVRKNRLFLVRISATGLDR